LIFRSVVINTVLTETSALPPCQAMCSVVINFHSGQGSQVSATNGNKFTWLLWVTHYMSCNLPMLPLLSKVITTGLVPRPHIRGVNYSIPVHRNFCLKIPTPQLLFHNSNTASMTNSVRKGSISIDRRFDNLKVW